MTGSEIFEGMLLIILSAAAILWGGISSVYYNRNNLLVWSIGVALVLIGSFGVILGTFWVSITFAENASGFFWIFLGSAVFWCGGSFVLAELLWRCWGV